MPESEALPGAPPRISELAIRDGDHEYAPVAGLWELREAIAGFYNDREPVERPLPHVPRQVRLAPSAIPKMLGVREECEHAKPIATARALGDVFTEHAAGGGVGTTQARQRCTEDNTPWVATPTPPSTRRATRRTIRTASTSTSSSVGGGSG